MVKKYGCGICGGDFSRPEDYLSHIKDCRVVVRALDPPSDKKAPCVFCRKGSCVGGFWLVSGVVICQQCIYTLAYMTLPAILDGLSGRGRLSGPDYRPFDPGRKGGE